VDGIDLAVTTADVEALATKLDALGAQLDEREQGVLLGVLALAAQSIRERTAASEVETFSTGFPVATVLSTPALGDGLRSAFQPFIAGQATKFGISSTSIILTSGFQKV
jgi:hypothetical protein